MEQVPLNKIRVLVVDDSPVTQRLYRGLIQTDARLELVGTASNGKQAIAEVLRLKPDVVSMDIEMPELNGLEATRQIMQHYPLPILIVSSLYNTQEAELAMQVLAAGAVGIINKPNGPGHPNFEKDARKYLQMLKVLSEVKVVKRTRTTSTDTSKASESGTQVLRSAEKGSFELLVIGASAGGPDALKQLLGTLSSNIPVPVLLVQHIDQYFAEGYCKWLSTFTTLPVQMITEETNLLPGHIYLPAPDKHLKVSTKGKALADHSEFHNGNRPSVGLLFNSALMVYGHRVLAVILSGMGSDGSSELLNLRKAGAYTIAQNEESCLVYGMPGEAVKLGAAIKVLSPKEIANEINNLIKH